ncbi:MAG: hypothetical protein NTW52_20075 [Planctomycetota bacterium]|nr:hypothetical protein [Planctomycetota bacterium]
MLVGERAFIVEHDNDIKPSHGAGKAQYCVLTVVNVKTMSVERIVPMAKSAQSFANETLPVGACFVPRIIQLNDTTLRCFFACEDQNGKSQSQTWHRDFDIASLTFAPAIHRVKLNTSNDTFDMQPQYFHADAARHGFKQPAKAFGLYLLDSFKFIDGKTYLAINNFPGAQNALAMLNESRDTIEVIGHYNEPTEGRLTESSVNRLPDGTWMAICRTKSGERLLQLFEIEVRFRKQRLHHRLHADPNRTLRQRLRLPIDHLRLHPADLLDVFRQRHCRIASASWRVFEDDDRRGSDADIENDEVGGMQRGQRREQQDGKDGDGVFHGSICYF